MLAATAAPSGQAKAISSQSALAIGPPGPLLELPAPASSRRSHRLERRGDTGPALEAQRALPHEDLEAVDHPRPTARADRISVVSCAP